MCVCERVLAGICVCIGEKREREGVLVNTCMCVLVHLHTLIVFCKSESGKKWGVFSFVCVCDCEDVCLRG